MGGGRTSTAGGELVLFLRLFLSGVWEVGACLEEIMSLEEMGSGDNVSKMRQQIWDISLAEYLLTER